MPTLTVTADAGGFISGNNATYATSRSTAAGSDTADGNYRAGQTTGFVVYRSFLRFDTSSLPDGATISSFHFDGSLLSDSSTTDFNIMITGNLTPTFPITTSDTDYDAALTAGVAASYLFRSTSGISTGTKYSSADLNTAWVNKTGYTYIVIISEEDINNSQPAAGEFVTFNGFNNVDTNLRPKLVINYTALGGTSTTTGTASATASLLTNRVFSLDIPKTAFTISNYRS